jgi:hypothetical protein
VFVDDKNPPVPAVKRATLGQLREIERRKKRVADKLGSCEGVFQKMARKAHAKKILAGEVKVLAEVALLPPNYGDNSRFGFGQPLRTGRPKADEEEDDWEGV